MKLKIDIKNKQIQGLSLTPQLQQAIKLLELSNIDLRTFVDKELEKNPLLNESYLDESENVEESIQTDSSLNNKIREREISQNLLSSPTQNRKSTTKEDIYLEIFENSVPNKSLREHLYEQLMMSSFTPTENIITHYLIDIVDDAGYLTEDTKHISRKLGVLEKLILDTLAKSQSFEPTGVFSRSLQECLTLQLQEKKMITQDIRIFLDNLDLIAENKYAEFTRISGLDNEKIKSIIDSIKTLNPKPGIVFSKDTIQTIIPDVIIEKKINGSYYSTINNESIPKVTINKSYGDLVKGSTLQDKERKYISNCLMDAKWLIKSIKQRASTLTKVSNEIILQQKDFLDQGVEYLKPLNLKTIADKVEMHESTISRITSNKYIQTPRGVYQLKYFFDFGVSSLTESKMVSSESVKYYIKNLIKNETECDRLSDDKLVNLLKKYDINIARRTVTKYRESLKIPSSMKRKNII
jgi:RNA polymerase sigma-54 factor